MSHSQWDVMKKTQMYFSKHTLQICASGDTITSPRRGSGAPQPPAVSLSLQFLQQISHCGFKRGGWKRSPGCPAQLAGSKNWVPGCRGGTSGCFAPFFIQNCKCPFPFPSPTTHAQAIPLVHSPFLLRSHTYLLRVGLTWSTN